MTTRRARWSSAAAVASSIAFWFSGPVMLADAVGIAVGEFQRIGIARRHDDAAEVHQRDVEV